jgi:glycosyltransferase involved in cell wall biosynthesis
LLESLACGTPVVSTSVGGGPEVVCGEVAGKLVNKREPAAIANAIATLLAVPRSPKAVRGYAERFSWGPTSRAQADLFDAAVQAHLRK